MIFLFAAIDLLDPCSTSPCENGATCNQHANGNDTVYDCTCAPGWTSTHCDLGRSFLISLPCLRYMQTLTFGMSENFWRMLILLPDINECSSSPCQNGATCENQEAAYSCSCVPGYIGANCETGKNIYKLLCFGKCIDNWKELKCFVNIFQTTIELG